MASNITCMPTTCDYTPTANPVTSPSFFTASVTMPTISSPGVLLAISSWMETSLKLFGNSARTPSFWKHLSRRPLAFVQQNPKNLKLLIAFFYQSCKFFNINSTPLAAFINLCCSFSCDVPWSPQTRDKVMSNRIIRFCFSYQLQTNHKSKNDSKTRITQTEVNDEYKKFLKRSTLETVIDWRDLKCCW